jgi:hypothetical protein
LPEYHNQQLQTLEKQMGEAYEDSRTLYLLQMDHAKLMTELISLRIAIMRGTLAAIRLGKTE